MDSGTSATLLRKGSKMVAARVEMIAEINTTTNVSPKDWKITCPLLPPITFRMPTSLLLPMAWAVERFTKLIEAMIKIKTPIKASV